VKHSIIGKVGTVIVIEVERSNRDFNLPAEMGILDALSPTGLKYGPKDDMHFTMRRLFFENDVSPMSGDSLPRSLGSTSSSLPMVLYHDPGQFLSKLVKVIKFHPYT